MDTILSTDGKTNNDDDIFLTLYHRNTFVVVFWVKVKESKLKVIVSCNLFVFVLGHTAGLQYLYKWIYWTRCPKPIGSTLDFRGYFYWAFLY